MPVRNILFIMADQLRADCWGAGIGVPGAKIETPHLEALARRGTRFDRAYCPAPICGPSRMGFYTGLYPSTHGATVNQAPLPLGTVTLGDRMRKLGLRTALAGKTHMKADREGMARMGLSDLSDQGVLAAECGFEPFARDDGLHPLEKPPNKGYNAYLRGKGYDGDNPWHDHANSALGPEGEILSGWYLRHADKPARVAPEDSETAWTTDRAMSFIDEQGDAPWCLHLSYIKPHWPYIAPKPYCGLFGPDSVWPAAPTAAAPHPVYRAFLDHTESVGFRRDGARERVIPTYLGLIRELDDHIGRLTAFLEARGRLDDTMIAFVSDHGDYLGDYGLGEKQLFHDVSARIPFFVVHPDLPGGQVSQAPVEGIDLVPTFLDALGGDPHDIQMLDGQPLTPFLRGEAPPAWRSAACCELDYATRQARVALGIAPKRARGWMLRGERWKYVHWLDLPPQLYDMIEDPRELRDLGRDPAHAATVRRMRDLLFEHFADRLTRTSFTAAEVEAETADYTFGGRIKMGVW
jgi:arylsulfatase A-like enzyme